jgi:hypothetical protein
VLATVGCNKPKAHCTDSPYPHGCAVAKAPSAQCG